MTVNKTGQVLYAQATGAGLVKRKYSENSDEGTGLKKRNPASDEGPGLVKRSTVKSAPFTKPIFNITEDLRKAHLFHIDKMVEKNGIDKGRPYCDPVGVDITGPFKTYSEGVGYELQQDVLINDKMNFDQTLMWALNNMQRKNVAQVFDPSVDAKVDDPWVPMPPNKQNSSLFLWQWRPALDGSRGGAMYQPNKAKGETFWDIDPAADGDQDIAAALLWADKMWGSNGPINYKSIALDILSDIWDSETIEINGQRYLMGGDTQNYCYDPITGESGVNGVDISYYRIPYYTTLFAQADPTHDWKSLAKPAYELIRKAQNATMHDVNGNPVQGAGYLFGDWLTIDPEGKIGDHGWKPHAEYHPPNDPDGDFDYLAGGDQFRENAWMALQALLDPSDADAKAYCDCAGDNMSFTECGFMKREMRAQNKIYSGYKIDGTVIWKNETLQTMSVYMAYLKVGAYLTGDKEAENDFNILYKRIMDAYHKEGYWNNYNNNAASWISNEHEYYGQHWTWFSLFLINNIDKIKGATR